MPCKCTTNPDELWISCINGVEEGQIEIGPETAGANDFEGTHRGHGQPIKGHCRAGMHFNMPAVRPQYLYTGKFIDDNCRKIVGKRHRVATPQEAESGELLFTDDWVATKPPQLVLGQESPESSELKPCDDGKAADETPSGE